MSYKTKINPGEPPDRGRNNIGYETITSKMGIDEERKQKIFSRGTGEYNP